MSATLNTTTITMPTNRSVVFKSRPTVFQGSHAVKPSLNQDKNMGKEGSAMKTILKYSEVSTVHGLSYVFSRTIPQVDRILWTFLTVTG